MRDIEPCWPEEVCTWLVGALEARLAAFLRQAAPSMLVLGLPVGCEGKGMRVP